MALSFLHPIMDEFLVMVIQIFAESPILQSGLVLRWPILIHHAVKSVNIAAGGFQEGFRRVSTHVALNVCFSIMYSLRSFEVRFRTNHNSFSSSRCDSQMRSISGGVVALS